MCHGWRCLGAIEKEEKVQKSNGNYSINQLFSYFAIKIKEDITALMTKFGREKSSSLSRQETGASLPLSLPNTTPPPLKSAVVLLESQATLFFFTDTSHEEGLPVERRKTGGEAL